MPDCLATRRRTHSIVEFEPAETAQIATTVADVIATIGLIVVAGWRRAQRFYGACMAGMRTPVAIDAEAMAA